MQDRHQRPRLQLVQPQPAVRRFGIRARDKWSRGTEAVGRKPDTLERRAQAPARTVQQTGVAEMVIQRAPIEVTASRASLRGMPDTWPAERCVGWAWVRNHEKERLPRNA